MGSVGVVVIGRNEGARLLPSLQSVTGQEHPVLYVDSASRDGSPDRARELGITVLELPDEEPLTAARGRNAGFQAIRKSCPGLDFIQFVDGDSRLAEGWIESARQFLDQRPEVAIVAGGVREVNREASIYNRLCDLEWNGPTGEVRSVGGIFMVRAAVFEAIAGFRADVFAGEEAELCGRVRDAGHLVVRRTGEMARHDAAMTRFSQWFRRTIRSGHAYALAAGRGSASDARQVRSFLFFGLFAPLLLIGSLLSMMFSPQAGMVTALVVLGTGILGTGFLGFRIARYRRSVGDSPADARLYAAFCVLAKFPQVLGFLTYWWNRVSRRRPEPVEHRAPPRAGNPGEMTR